MNPRPAAPRSTFGNSLRVAVIASVIGTLAAAPGCGTTYGPRLGEDAFVVGTAPVQIPVNAARDAGTNFDSTAANVILFPLTFPLYLLEHSLLTVVHALDLLAFPAHFFHSSDTTGIYRGIDLPLERGHNGHVISEGFAAVAFLALVIGLPIAAAIFVGSLQVT